jgi:hypothetical protein
MDEWALPKTILPFYHGIKTSKLVTMLLLVTTCTTHKVSNKFVDELLSLLCHTILPQPNTLPKNFHETKSMIKKLGLSYERLHAYPKGCVFFLKMI